MVRAVLVSLLVPGCRYGFNTSDRDARDPGDGGDSGGDGDAGGTSDVGGGDAPAGAAVTFDAGSESHTGTVGSANEASFSWTHTPVGTPRGVLVFTHSRAAADIALGVTYGGVPLTAVPGGRAVDTAGSEVCDCKAWMLGSGVPAGPQPLIVTRTNNATVMYAAAATVTAPSDTQATVPVLLQEDGTLAEQSVDDGSPATSSLRFAGLSSGLNAGLPGVGPNSTAMVDINYNGTLAMVVRETTAGQGLRPVGFSSATLDDRAAVHLAVTVP
jgi:hypothetical protein